MGFVDAILLHSHTLFHFGLKYSHTSFRQYKLRLLVSNITLINKNDKSTYKTLTLTTFIRDRQHFLKMMHIHGLWLKCHCVQAGAIAFVKRNKFSFVLVNHAIEGKHDFRCSLHTDVSGEINAGEHTPQSSPKAPTGFTPLKINVAQDKINGGAFNKQTQSSRHKADRIHSLLSYALTEKQFNVLNVNKAPNLNALFYSKMFKLPVTKHDKHTVKVSDITFILPNEKARDYQRTLMRLKYKFANEVPLQCNFIFVVDNLSIDLIDKSFTYKQNHVDRTVRAIRQIHHYQRTTGPRIVFLIKAFIEGCWQNYLAYSHPILTTAHPILVDSSLERRFAQLFLENGKVGASLTKPYLSTEFQGNHLLPDFIFKDAQREPCLVEVMGLLDQEDYQERKARLVPLMRQRFKMKVIEVTPQDLAQKAIDLFSR
jgi:hypothetical protein|tara:strand:+ start:10758 stop:12038 length:1281 start_codon:yes stop_codon:yes gene_type:complete